MKVKIINTLRAPMTRSREMNIVISKFIARMIFTEIRKTKIKHRQELRPQNYKSYGPITFSTVVRNKLFSFVI